MRRIVFKVLVWRRLVCLQYFKVRWFWKQLCKKESLPKVASEATICKYSSKLVFLKISLYSQSVVESVFNKLYLKETSTQVFSCEYCKIFTNSFIDRALPVAAFVSFIKFSGHLPISLLNQKHNLGWFLPKRFVDLVRVSYLHSISRNHSKSFHWLTCRKQELVQSKAQQLRVFVLILESWQCRQVFVDYLLF